jgi:hypothetical protein
MTVKGPGGGGPPSGLETLSDERFALLIRRVRKCTFWVTIALEFNVHRNTLQRWRQEQETDRGAKLRAAEAFAMRSLVRQARRGEDAKAAQWLCEKRWPKVFGSRAQKIEHSGPKGGAIEIAASVVILPELDAEPAAERPVAAEPRPADEVPGLPRE